MALLNSEAVSYHCNVRERRNFTVEEKAELEKQWNEGMTTTASTCTDKIAAVAARLDIDVQHVKAWIGNKRASLKKTGQTVHRKPTIPVRGPSAFSLFCEKKKRGNQAPGQYFKALNEEWALVSDDEKAVFRQKAQDIRKNPALNQDRDRVIRALLTTLSVTCEKLQKLNVEAGGIACGQDGLPVIFGSPKANSFFSSSTDTFVVAMLGQQGSVPTGNVEHKLDPQAEKTKLRAEVRSIFNTCWVKAGGKEKCLPYKKVMAGKISLEVTGLPEEIHFADPSSMGISSLRQIIASQERLCFTLRSTPTSEHVYVNAGEVNTEKCLESSTDEAGSQLETLPQLFQSLQPTASSSGVLESVEQTLLDVKEPAVLPKRRKTQRSSKQKSRKRQAASLPTSEQTWPYERILGERMSNGHKELHVKWVGGEETWEPENNFDI